MGMHDLGYRKWNGTLASAWARWTVITETSVKAAWKSHWVRRLLFFACMPALWYGLAFFLFEQAMQRPEYERYAYEFIQEAHPRMGMEGMDFRGDPAQVRHQFWSVLLLSYLRNPQAVIMVMIIGMIAPPLISQDVRSRAFLLYFSRPIDRLEYLIGKSATVWAYMLAITAVPCFLLYLMGVLLSPGVNVVAATWDLPFRVLLASAVLMIPTTSLALMFSSLTQESRYAAFSWYLVWIFGWLTFVIMQSTEPMHQFEEWSTEPSRWSYLSLFHILGEVQNWIFGFTTFSKVTLHVIILLVVTLVSHLILYRRISAPMRA